MATRTWEHLGTWQKNQWDDPRTGNSMVIPAKWAIWRKTVHPKSYDLLWCHHVRLSLSLTSTSKSVFGEPIKGNKGKVIKSLKTKVLYNLSPQTKYHALCSHDLQAKGSKCSASKSWGNAWAMANAPLKPKGQLSKPSWRTRKLSLAERSGEAHHLIASQKDQKSQSERFDTIWEADRS